MEPMASSGFGYPGEEPVAAMGSSGTNYPEEWGESWPQSNGMGLDDFFEQQMMDMILSDQLKVHHPNLFLLLIIL